MEPVMSYQLTIIQKPAYLHAIVAGLNSKENVKAYLADRPDIQALNACRCTLPQQNAKVGNGGL